MFARERREDLLFIFVGLLLCVEIVVLLSQLRVLQFEIPWFKDQSKQSAIGQVLERTKTVKDRSSGNLTWYPLTQGDAIHASDLVMTGPDSSARIKVEGEGELFLGPDTLVSFGIDRSSPTRSVLQLDMDQGSLTVASRGKPVTIRLKNRNLNLEAGTEVVLSQTVGSQDSKVAVKKGAAKLEAFNQAVVVHTGESFELNAFEKISEPVKVEAAAPVPTLTPLPSIHYEPISPKENLSIRLGTPLHLEWKPIPGAIRYHVELSKLPDFSKNILAEDFKNTSAPIGRLEAGRFFWRIRAEHETLGVWPVSETFSFTIKEPLSAPKPKGVERFKKTGSSSFLDFLIPSAFADDGVGNKEQIDVVMKWEPTPGAERYRLEVSAKEDFKILLKTIEVRETSAQVTLPKNELYFWRVAGRDKDGELGLFSPPQRIRYADFAPQKPPEVIISPEPKKPPSPQIVSKPVVELKSHRRLGVGVAGHYIRQGASGDGIEIEQTGLPVGKLGAELAMTNREQELLISGWYEARKFVSKDGLPRDILPDLYQKEFSLEVLWIKNRGALYPFAIGLKYARTTQFDRTGPEVVTASPLNLFSAVAGPTYMFGERPYYKVALLVEATPLSAAKGLGIDARGAIGYRRYFVESITPELRFGAHPTYTRLDLLNQSVLTFNFTAGFFLTWEFDRAA